MLENPRSERVRAVARLARRQGRRATGQFLVEGPQAVGEVLAWRPESVDELYLVENVRQRHPDLVRAAEAAGIRPWEASEQVLAAMADTVTPQGVVAVCRQTTASLDDVLAGAPRLVALLEEVRDPGNAGTIIRVADAVGADAVVLLGDTVDPFQPKVVRSTTGSLFHLPVVQAPDLPTALAAVRAAGLAVLAADIDGERVPELRASGALGRPTAWLFGNEARGLSESARAAVDRIVTLPVYGHAESLNLATAASVCLYESAFAQRED